MLTLQTPAGSTMLPPREPNIPLDLFTFKQATGFLIWNGKSGEYARFYLMKFQRSDYPNTPVARFFGGTAIPFPHSLRGSGVQSLIRMAEYFGINLPETAGDDFVPLHHFMKTETTVHEQVDVANARQVTLPVSETHGLLPADDAFIEAHRHKLEEVSIIQGSALQDPGVITTENNLPFNDSGMLPVLRHLLQQGPMAPTKRSIKTVLNPEWAKGDYTPHFDTPQPQYKGQSFYPAP